MSNKKSNASAIKSREWITEALLTIMATKDFQKITVSEIIAEADLTRQTFYRHFKSKEDVVMDYARCLYEECFRDVNRLEDPSLFNVLVTYFRYWEENRHFLSLVYKNKMNFQLLDFYYPIMSHSLDMFDACFDTRSDTELQNIKLFILGGLSTLKMNWMATDYRDSPETLAQTVVNLLNVRSHQD